MNIDPNVSPMSSSINKSPDPNIPAKPVPDEKIPTIWGSKYLQKPKIVASPKEEEIP